MEQRWRLVPVGPSDGMLAAANDGDREYTLRNFGDVMTVQQGPWDHYAAMLAAAPEPPHMSMTREEAQTFQSWAGMDGACAFHLIERHANGWGDVARMMDAWLAANRETPNVGAKRADTAPAAFDVSGEQA